MPVVPLASARRAAPSWRRAAAVACLVVLCAPLVTLVMVITHEIGHTVVARVLGDDRATFLLYGHDCFGCNLYDSARLAPWGNVAVSLGGLLFTALLTIAAVLALGWHGRPRWLPRWLLAEVIVICYGGDLVWQFVQAVQQLPVPDREPLGWGFGYTDLDAATSFGSQATGLSHQAVATIGVAGALLYTLLLAMALRAAWRRGTTAADSVAPSAAPVAG